MSIPINLEERFKSSGKVVKLMNYFVDTYEDTPKGAFESWDSMPSLVAINGTVSSYPYKGSFTPLARTYSMNKIDTKWSEKYHHQTTGTP